MYGTYSIINIGTFASEDRRPTSSADWFLGFKKSNDELVFVS
jgi:hypothetical protein